MMTYTPLHETFGIELEIVVRQDRPKDIHPMDMPNVERAMIDELQQAGFAVTRYDGKWDPNKWTVDLDGTIHRYCQEEEYDENDLDEKQGLYPDDSLYRHKCSGVELKSPAFPNCEESLDEVRKVIELLNSKFDIVANESTGFHVHVGNERRGYPLDTLRKFVTLLAVFESQIEALHPPHRIDNMYCESLFAMDFTDPTEIIADIARHSKTLRRLIREVQGDEEDDKYVAYNFLNLLRGVLPEKPRHRLNTIEFRQHEGTFEAERVLAWIRFTTKLVSFSHNVPNDQYLQLIKDHGGNENSTALDLILEMEEPDLHSYYLNKGHMYSHPKRPVESDADEAEEVNDRPEDSAEDSADDSDEVDDLTDDSTDDTDEADEADEAEHSMDDGARAASIEAYKWRIWRRTQPIIRIFFSKTGRLMKRDTAEGTPDSST